ncbi:MAG: tRNA (adenosine(37)-N6)-threonylcarbamoyltransferase complex ATPase subunit type 1 TsaE [Bacteroidales bacterium]|nr:tRNA (adenosine(37)-N6)-threonylcarbamoyltransferase complex ATPase subunit type 1 TsaE [Bacteroidales bacterium]
MSEKYRLKAKTTDDLILVAKEILKKSNDVHFFSLYGKMGAGKTTLIKAFAEVLGSDDNVTSPTFSIVNEYSDKNGKSFYHFDFYRINSLEEVYDMGFEEYLYNNSHCFFEWPEKISELLPETYVYITINVNEKEEREIEFGIHHAFNHSEN